MTILPRFSRWRGPPLALQIMGLLLGGLVMAQLVTLLLTLAIPPEPPAKYDLADIAAALRGDTAGGLRSEERDAAPAVEGRGWLVPAASRGELARLLGVAPERVALAFYTPLPFAGTIGLARPAPPAPPAMKPRPIAHMLSAGRIAPDPAMRPAVLMTFGTRVSPADFLQLVQAAPGPGPGAGSGPGGFPRAGGFPERGGGPGGDGRQSGFPGGRTHDFPQGGAGEGRAGLPPLRDLPDASRSNTPSLQAGNMPGTSPTIAGPPAPAGRGSRLSGAARRAPAVPGAMLFPGLLPTPADVPPVSLPSQDAPPEIDLPPASAQAAEPQSEPAPTPRQIARPAVPAEVPPAPLQAEKSSDRVDTAVPDAAVLPRAAPADVATPRAGLQRAFDSARSLLGLAPAPFVEGDFVATLRLPDGRWRVVQPRAGGLLSPWQKRVALWFLLAFGLTAPFGWLFARRLSRPLDRFADAAAQLGRDPSVAIAALDGPAEIGRAAHAFNLMQQRLRSFVDDRTAMVGAISHDLRTPLTRMRFRVEDAPDELRAGMLDELDEMEEMIASVLAFIRDASTPGARERLDLRTLVEDVVEDAAVVGADVAVEGGEGALVEVEVMGMRRVLANLLENALKYGAHARIRLTVSQEEAIAAVIDDGPGLPDDELEQVFQPFYRTAGARASGAPGTGLGLAVCRSIARAHGGDVRLCRTAEGFRAEVRVPLAYEAARALAA